MRPTHRSSRHVLALGLPVGGLLWLGLSACPPPASKCRTHADCDETVRSCQGGVCKPLLSTALDGGALPLPDASTADAATIIPEDCVVIGVDWDSNTVAGGAVRFGALLPKTKGAGDGGRLPDPRGRLREQALRLVVEELNPPRPGLNGRAMSLLSCDSAGDTTRATALAQQLITLGAVAIISSGSAETLAVSTSTIRAGVLLMSSSATSPEISDLLDRPTGSTGAGLVWRTAASDAFQGTVLANVLRTDVACVGQVNPPPRTWVIYRNDPYGQGLYGAFRRDHGVGNQAGSTYADGGEVPASLNSANDYFNSDAGTQPASQVLLIIGFPEQASLIADATLNVPGLVGVPLLFTDSAKAPSLFGGTHPSRLEGACGTAPASADPQSPAFEWFGTQYLNRFGEDPLAASFVANSFDAMMLLAISAARASILGEGVTGQTLANGLTHLSDVTVRDGGVLYFSPEGFNAAVSQLAGSHDINVEGTSGPLDFDSDKGEAPAGVQVWQVVDGGFVTLRTVAP